VASLAPALACPRVIPDWRVGITPDPSCLSTVAALDDQLQEWSKSMHDKARDWEALLLAYTP
jgi:hypothetical protein